MKCVNCGRSPADGASLFRRNPKGEPGVFACERCDPQNAVRVKNVYETVAVLERKQGRKLDG